MFYSCYGVCLRWCVFYSYDGVSFIHVMVCVLFMLLCVLYWCDGVCFIDVMVCVLLM